MKYTISVLLAIFTQFVVYAQDARICTLHEHGTYQSSESMDSLSFNDNSEAYSYLKKLLDSARMPMNFHLRRCNSSRCSNNAFAEMDALGNQFITYDPIWFNKIESDSLKPKSLTILAHELGHHIMAHTLGFDREHHSESINYCERNFNPNLCSGEILADYKVWLSKSRVNELQADRCSGYIVGAYGLDRNQAISWLNEINDPKDESMSTHPLKSDRRIAILEGFDMAIEDLKKKAIPNLQEIGKVPFELLVSKNASKLERNRLVDKVYRATWYNVIGIMSHKSKYTIAFYNDLGIANQSVKDQAKRYFNKELTFEKHDTETDYFSIHTHRLGLEHNMQILSTNYIGIHVLDGILRIILFSQDDYKVIYKSIHKESEINFQSLITRFTKLYTENLQKAIFEYEAKN